MKDESTSELGKALEYYSFSPWRAFATGHFVQLLSGSRVEHVGIHENGVLLTVRDGKTQSYQYSDLAIKVTSRDLGGGGLVGMGARMMASERDKVDHYELSLKNGEKILHLTGAFGHWHDLGERLFDKIEGKSNFRKLGKL